MTNAALPAEASLPVGVVVERRPGVTRWAREVWRPTALLPGAAPARWRLLSDQDGVATFHAATLPLRLHRAETEGYRQALAMTPPAVFVVMRANDAPDAEQPWEPFLVTASAHDAQDYLDSGAELVEALPAPPGLLAWVRDFTVTRHAEEPFVKRRRGEGEQPEQETSRGDARIRQDSDVFRAPGALKPARRDH